MLEAALVIALLVAQTPAAAPPPPAPFDAQARVTEALNATRAVAYDARTADWPAIERRARALAVDAKDSVDLLPAYLAILHGLGNKHAFLTPPQSFQDIWRARYGSRRLLPDTPPRSRPTSSFQARKDIETRVLGLPSGRTAAAIVVPSVQWLEGSINAPYGNSLYRAVTGHARNACGFLLDFRGNTGGDVFPMVSGLSPLIGDGYRFGSRDASGKLSWASYLQRGAAKVDDPKSGKTEVLNQVDGWAPHPKLAAVPVAVLHDDGTASSGELSALAFRGRPRTRSFGATTWGVVSANEMVELSDGVRLMVPVSYSTDRAGRTYPDGLLPDQPVSAGPGTADDPDDAVVEAAKGWLATQPGCAR